VEVVASESVKKYVKSRGGVVYIRAHPHHCCTGWTTLLDSTTSPPRDLTGFVEFEADGIEVRFCAGSSGRPSQLLIELRGLFKRRPVAFWDGCAFRP
jgi:hypothetical protein